jgi:hypothetical protein
MSEYPTVPNRSVDSNPATIGIYPTRPRLIGCIDTCTFGAMVKNGIPSPLRFAVLVDSLTRYARVTLLGEGQDLWGFVKQCARRDGAFKVYQGDRRPENDVLVGAGRGKRVISLFLLVLLPGRRYACRTMHVPTIPDPNGISLSCNSAPLL